jgi:hypothetical protein
MFQRCRHGAYFDLSIMVATSAGLSFSRVPASGYKRSESLRLQRSGCSRSCSLPQITVIAAFRSSIQRLSYLI